MQCDKLDLLGVSADDIPLITVKWGDDSAAGATTEAQPRYTYTSQEVSLPYSFTELSCGNDSAWI